jgi:hypothetical protein
MKDPYLCNRDLARKLGTSPISILLKPIKTSFAGSFQVPVSRVIELILLQNDLTVCTQWGTWVHPPTNSLLVVSNATFRQFPPSFAPLWCALRNPFLQSTLVFLLLPNPGPGTYTLVRNMSGLSFRELPLSPATECLIRNEETL